MPIIDHSLWELQLWKFFTFWFQALLVVRVCRRIFDELPCTHLFNVCILAYTVLSPLLLYECDLSFVFLQRWV